MSFLKKHQIVFFSKLADILTKPDGDKTTNQYEFNVSPKQGKETWLLFASQYLIFLAILLIISFVTQNPIFTIVGIFIITIAITGYFFVIINDNPRGFIFGGFIVSIVKDFKLFDTPDTGILAIANKVSLIANSIVVSFRLLPNHTVYITSFIWLYLFFFIMLGIRDLINPVTRL